MVKQLICICLLLIMVFIIVLPHYSLDQNQKPIYTFWGNYYTLNDIEPYIKTINNYSKF